MISYSRHEQEKDEQNLFYAFLRSVKEGTILSYYNQTFERYYQGRVIKRNEERIDDGRGYYVSFEVQILDDEGNDREGHTDTAFLQHILSIVKI